VPNTCSLGRRQHVLALPDLRLHARLERRRHREDRVDISGSPFARSTVLEVAAHDLSADISQRDRSRRLRGSSQPTHLVALPEEEARDCTTLVPGRADDEDLQRFNHCFLRICCPRTSRNTCARR